MILWQPTHQTSRRHSLRAGQDDGSISLLILGLCVIALTLILGIITVTTVHLARIRLLDAADAAALNAADAIDSRVYTDGVGSAVPLTDDSVWLAASDSLASRSMPDRVRSWSLAPGTGSPDGETAVVVVTGTAELPILSRAVEFIGSSITLTVESRARATVAG
ncbi:MAG: pilus assembly protein TadG-related protein [Actinobacteria bacterium]|nr:pilus assembly protein TadG-related protein [Actinomycetota bacterium]